MMVVGKYLIVRVKMKRKAKKKMLLKFQFKGFKVGLRS